MTPEGWFCDMSALGMFFSFKLASNLLCQPGLRRPLETWLAHMSAFQAWHPHFLITCITQGRGCWAALGSPGLGVSTWYHLALISLGKESADICGTGWSEAKGEKLSKKHVCDAWALGRNTGHLGSQPPSSMKHATASSRHTLLLLKLISGNFCRCEDCPPSQPGRYSRMFQL